MRREISWTKHDLVGEPFLYGNGKTFYTDTVSVVQDRSKPTLWRVFLWEGGVTGEQDSFEFGSRDDAFDYAETL